MKESEILELMQRELKKSDFEFDITVYTMLAQELAKVRGQEVTAEFSRVDQLIALGGVDIGLVN